jgi:hypothetical protein
LIFLLIGIYMFWLLQLFSFSEFYISDLLALPDLNFSSYALW